MTLQELHNSFQEYLYIEDTNVINVTLASIVANSLQVGDPIWLTIIGPSSGGKSQIIRPFAMAHNQYIHRIDDLTPQTFISGTLGAEDSLLGRIGKAGILSMDDLTVLFSKGNEERGQILSQFRMIYDGHFSKGFGNRKDDVEWSGYLGMIAGSTPSIYRYFSEVADMGERFISYRMKDIDVPKAVSFVSERPHTSKELNEKLAEIIREYLKPLLQSLPNPEDRPQLHQVTHDIIKEASIHCTLLRTPIHIDERTGLADEFPDPEMPFRVMKQLTYLAQGMQCLQEKPEEPLSNNFHQAIQWTAYSLVNDKRRAYARAIAFLYSISESITPKKVATITGMNPEIVKKGLSQLQLLGMIKLVDEQYVDDNTYNVVNLDLFKFVRQVDPMDYNNYNI